MKYSGIVYLSELGATFTENGGNPFGIYPDVGGCLEVLTSPYRAKRLPSSCDSLKEKEGILYQMMMMIEFDLVLSWWVPLQL